MPNEGECTDAYFIKPPSGPDVALVHHTYDGDSWSAPANAEFIVRAVNNHAALLKLAKEATNGWACYARTKLEHKEIDRLHRAIREAEAK